MFSRNLPTLPNLDRSPRPALWLTLPLALGVCVPGAYVPFASAQSPEPPRSATSQQWLISQASTPLQAMCDAEVDRQVSDYEEPVTITVWLGTDDLQPLYRHQADRWMPAASAIKTAILVELFAKYHESLPTAPKEVSNSLEPQHPAVKHFNRTQQGLIQAGLSHQSAQDLGKIMMGSKTESNLVYNAAANVNIALLGGPEKTTELIASRYQRPIGIKLQRYMLAPRDEPGDNLATAEGLATVLCHIANGNLPNVDPGTSQAVAEAIILTSRRFELTGIHQLKDGALDSDPLTRVQSGFYRPQRQGNAYIYVVMASQAAPQKYARDETGNRLNALVLSLTGTLLRNAVAGSKN